MTTGTVITNATISYGGANGKGNVYVYSTGTDVSITNNTITNSGTYGVYADSGATFSSSDEASCTFSNNAYGDVYRK